MNQVDKSEVRSDSRVGGRRGDFYCHGAIRCVGTEAARHPQLTSWSLRVYPAGYPVPGFTTYVSLARGRVRKHTPHRTHA